MKNTGELEKIVTIDSVSDLYLYAEKNGDPRIYKNSIRLYGDKIAFMVKTRTEKLLIIRGSYDERLIGFQHGNLQVCPCCHQNAKVLRAIFPFTNPVSIKRRDASIGLGDRLGLASPAHLRILKGKKVLPVIAQQSMRELALTRRCYEDVLDEAVYAIFQEGYEDGYGMDGDHLKTEDEVRNALNAGCTMITLDCSDYLKDPSHLDHSSINWNSINKKTRRVSLSSYCLSPIVLGTDVRLQFSKEDILFNELMYGEAIAFIENIYHRIIGPFGRNVDLEISLDESAYPTTPLSHYFIASELLKRGVKFVSLAPRFAGRFEKGIDYIGDITEFKKDIFFHQQIAANFGYKLSIHSGSDKFSVMPIIAAVTRGSWHVKTSGTYWLEALRFISMRNPVLFRQIYLFALSVFEDSRKIYPVSSNIDVMHGIDRLGDSELPQLFDVSALRQLMHITYGEVLGARDYSDEFIFKNRIYAVLKEHEEAYYQCLNEHLKKHLSALGI